MEEKRLFLLDAYALIFRAYYALIKMPRLTRDGFNTSAIFGFVNTLEEILRKENPTHIAVCFDPQGPTFRSEADASYKAKRESTPEDIKKSIPIIKEIIKAYNIPVLEIEGFEADDLIGTMAKRAEQEGFTTYMMSPDKDFGQLVSPTVLQYKPSYRGQDFELRGVEEVCARFKISNPAQVVDLLALMGDKIDNIPGCPGVGEVTAVKLLDEYGSIESLLEHKEELKGALKKKIEENEQVIRDSYFLATIRTDVPVKETPDDLVRKKEDRDKLFAIFKEMEFRSLSERVARRLDGGKAGNTGAPSLFSDEETGMAPQTVKESDLKIDCGIITDAEGLRKVTDRIGELKECGVVIVAEGENDMDALIKGAAIALSPEEAYYIPATFAEGMAAVLDTMARPDIEKVSVQAKRDYVLAGRLRMDDAVPLTNYYDVAVAHYLLQPEMRHSLDNLAALYLGFTTSPEPVFTPKRGSRQPAADINTIAAWSGECAALPLSLKPLIAEEIAKQGLEKLLEEVELPLSAVLARMETAGVRLDVDALNDAADTLRKRMTELEREVFALAGEEFNIGSPARVGEILFDKLQLDPKAKKTKTGQYSTGEDVLEKVAHKNPIVGKILEYRQVKKLLTTYLTALPEAINPATGKVHTVYNQTVVATGRISSSAPNLQNIPVREDQGREIRRAFIPDEGHLFLSADYSQIELRLVADFANEQTMIDAFQKGDDIHAITAAKIYHKEPADVTADERRNAKTANFGILYGISPFGLASRLGIPRGEAKEIIDNYFETFPTIKQYMHDSVENARDNGYVTTKVGRKRYLPDINSKNPVVRGYAERNAINAPIQGTAADIIKVAMVEVQKEFDREGLRSRMIMQVHDELNFDVVPEELPKVQEIVARCMEGAYNGKVRLTSSSGVAENWLDAH